MNFMISSLTSYYVYIVECSDQSYYTGVTNNADGRVWEHNNSEDKNSYTYSRRPVVLKFVEVWEDIYGAINREKQIKGWSRKKKEALINGNDNDLSKLSKGRNGYLHRKFFK